MPVARPYQSLPTPSPGMARTFARNARFLDLGGLIPVERRTLRWRKTDSNYRSHQVRRFEATPVDPLLTSSFRERDRRILREKPTVRIPFAPANSPSLARFLVPVSKSRQLPRCVRARPGGTAGRDAQGSSISRQLPVISLSGPFPVPRCRLGRLADRGRSGALSEVGSPRDSAM